MNQNATIERLEKLETVYLEDLLYSPRALKEPHFRLVVVLMLQERPDSAENLHQLQVLAPR